MSATAFAATSDAMLRARQDVISTADALLDVLLANASANVDDARSAVDASDGSDRVAVMSRYVNALHYRREVIVRSHLRKVTGLA